MKTFRTTGPFQSLSAFEWNDIPRFAVITGENGVGKSQLLRLLAIRHDAAHIPVDAIVSSTSLFVDEAARLAGYLPSNWVPEVVPVSTDIFHPIDVIYKFAVESEALAEGPPSEDALAARLSGPIAARAMKVQNASAIVKRLRAAGGLRPGLSREEMVATIEPYGLVDYDPAKPLQALAEMFYCYASANRSAAYVSPHREWRNPPWDAVNGFLALLGVRIRLEPPDDPRFSYELVCSARPTWTIEPSALSAGEQSVLVLAAVMASTLLLRGRGWDTEQVPDLLILDEPDAHLHTSLVKEYVDNLQMLVKKGTQIILATHRPDTIALVPEDSLFEMRRSYENKTTIAKVGSRSTVIASLAADTITVLPNVRVVLVEDEDDRIFHQAMYERACELRLVPERPPLVFMPVNAKGGGGRDQVEKRRALMQSKGLGSLYAGLLDGDNRTTPPPPGILRLPRYALENYLADPLALYCSIVNEPDMDADVQFSEQGGVPLGRLHELRTFEAARLQAIADLVLAPLEQKIGPALQVKDPARRATVTLHLASNRTVDLQYPIWLHTVEAKPLCGALAKYLHKGIVGGYLHGPTRAGFVPADIVPVYRKLVTETL